MTTPSRQTAVPPEDSPAPSPWPNPSPSPVPTSAARFALVGTGHRAELYAAALLGSHRAAGELVALLDPNEVRMDYYQDLYRQARGDGDGPPRYGPGQFDEMVRRARVGTVIVTTVDRWHADYVVRALELGCTVLCEKPLTTDAQGCRRIVEAVERTGGRVVVTFNYRYSPRNSAVKQLLAAGAIGEVTSVHFEWVLDTMHGADYFRRWHREKVNSGGLLVHKSGHHFDLVNWWLDDVPETVSAHGGLRFYGAGNAAARGPGPRPERSHGAPGLGTDPFLIDLAADPRLRRLYLDAEGRDGYLRDRDVFADGITIEDNLAVLARYHRGALLTYALNAHSPWEGYRVTINGTRGRLELDVCERPAVSPPAAGHGPEVDPMAAAVAATTTSPDPSPPPTAGTRADGSAAGTVDPAAVDPLAVDLPWIGPAGRRHGETLTVQRHWETARQVDLARLAAQDPVRPPRGGAHGGGDLLLLDDVLLGAQAVGPDPLHRAADYLDGVRSVLVGVAANLSLETGRPVALADLGVPLPPTG